MNIEQPKNIDMDFEARKRKFFSDFAMRHRNELRLHKEFGVLAKHEGWRNVSEHCLVEAVAIDTLARELKLSDEDRKKLVTAAFLHDFYKRKEIEAAKAGGVEEFNKAVQKSSDVMSAHGFSDDIINLTESVGHSSLKRMQEKDVTLLENIMHYTDDIIVGSDIVSLDERMDANEANPKYKELDESGRKIFDGKTYFQVQREVGHEIEKDLANRLGLENSKELPGFIREKIHERINQES